MIAARPDITPAFAERNVPVAFATDENYLPYVDVAVNSVVANSAGSNLDILILHSGISDELIQAFISRYAGFESVSVRFVDMTDALTGSRLADYEQVDRLPVSSCYRLLIPDLLTAYDKLIYLDVDVAVCRDLGELYSTDLGDCYFAAAKDVVHSTNPEYLAWAAGWGFAEWNDYVNTGILVMNLDRFRREPVLDRLSTVVLEAAKWLCDQDALNFVCKGRIAPLDPRWNVQVGDYCLKEQLAITKDEAYLYHFAGRKKPWKRPDHKFAYLWWRNARDDGPKLWRSALGLAEDAADGRKARISVIVPVYNARRYLWECLLSVLGQSEVVDVEIVCVDDGSTDDSCAIIETMQKLDSRVKLLRQHRQGPGAARNAGLDIATGEYIVFLDADDRMTSGDALMRACEQAERDGLDMMLASYSVITEDGEVFQADAGLNSELIPKEPVFPSDALGASQFLCTSMGPWGKLYRRTFLEENKLRFPPLKRSEDFPMVELAIALSSRIGIFTKSIYDHRIGIVASLESTKDETPLIFFEAEQLLRDSLQKRNLWHRFKAAVYSAFVFRLAYNLREVRSYSSFNAIISKYRLESQKWVCWDDVSMPERFANNLQLVKGLEEAMDDNDQIALFVKLREAKATARAKARLSMVEEKLAKSENRREELWTERRALKSDLLAVKRELAESQKRRGEMWSERGILKSDLSAVKGKLAESQRRRSEMWTELGALKSDLLAVKRELAESQKRRGEMWTEMQAAEKAKAGLWARLQESEKARAKIWRERCALSASVQSLKTTLEKINKAVEG